MSGEMLDVYGQPSFTLATSSVHVAITRFGAMLAPVTFFADSPTPIQPYAIAPWATETLGPEVPPLLAALRGDFICSAFGDNVQPWDGCTIPPHGDTANGNWHLVHRRESDCGSALRLEIDLGTQGGRCVATTVLLQQHQFVYQRHDFVGFAGRVNPGHHAMLQCTSASGPARISFSSCVLAGSSPPRAMLPDSLNRSRLRPGSFASDATRMPCLDGSISDFTKFPACPGTDDVLIVCADPAKRIAWSAATFPQAGYAWLSLRNTCHLPSTLVWQSDGGRSEPPWSSRHVGVLALEDMMGYFALGLAESAAENPLNANGIATCVEVRLGELLRIPYIQGLVRVPAQFDQVAAVRMLAGGELLVQAANGTEVRTACRWEFLSDGRVPLLCED